MRRHGVYVRLTPDELDRVRADPSAARPLIEGRSADAPRRRYRLDEAWQAVWYLLRRAGAPTRVIMEGTPLWDSGDEEDDAPSVFTPSEVSQAARWLSAWPAERLASYFDCTAFARADIYPPIWNRRNGTDHRAWVVGYYAGLPQFFATAAVAGDALMLWIG